MANKLFNALTNQDKEVMNSWIDQYVGEVKSKSTRADLETLMQTWSEEKANLFEIFGNELILSKTVAIERPVGVMEQDICNSFFGASRDFNGMKVFADAFFNWFYDLPSSERPSYNTLNLVNHRNLATNSYSIGEPFEVNLPDGKILKVQKGTKPLRVLAKMAQAFNLEGFEEFRLTHSRILNQKKMTGELCLSIHPMDFMTMSDNNSNWESCMSWSDYGCYRRGTVEMMNSECVVVAYLRAKEDMKVSEDLYWNNKKWRTLIIVDSNCITNVKNYPFNSDELTTVCMDWLVELCQERKGWKYFSETAKFDYYDSIEIKESHIDEYDAYFDTYDMYNDFDSCSHLIRIGRKAPSIIRINYSGEASCMHCGKVHVDFMDNDGAETLVCEECDSLIRCQCCGYRISMDNAYEVDGELVCDYCYTENTATCAITGDLHLEDNIKRLYLALDEEDANKFDCENCSFKRVSLPTYFRDEDNFEKAKELFKPSAYKVGKDTTFMFRMFSHKYSPWENHYYVTVDDCTEKGLEFFGYDKDTIKDYIEARRLIQQDLTERMKVAIDVSTSFCPF